MWLTRQIAQSNETRIRPSFLLWLLPVATELRPFACHGSDPDTGPGFVPWFILFFPSIFIWGVRKHAANSVNWRMVSVFRKSMPVN